MNMARIDQTKGRRYFINFRISYTYVRYRNERTVARALSDTIAFLQTGRY